MSNIVDKVKLDPNFLKDRINYTNPLWFVNHLSKEDKTYLINNMKELLSKTDKYGVEYQIAANLSAHDDELSEFSHVRTIKRTIEVVSGKKLRIFGTPTNCTRTLIPIASDFIHMMHVFCGEDRTKSNEVPVRSLAIYEFNNIHDVIGFIDAAGSIGDKIYGLTFYDIIEAIRPTIQMLFVYLNLMDIENSKFSELRNFDIMCTIENIYDIEPYFSANIYNYVDHAHVVTFLNEVLKLYILCSVDNVEDTEKLKSDIMTGYLYRKVEYIYYGTRKELENILDGVISTVLPAEGTPNTIARKESLEKLEKSIFISENERACESNIDHLEKIDPMENLTFKEKEEIEKLCKIEESDVITSIYEKIGVREDSVMIKSFSDISEELLAMYLAEFNNIHPLYIFPSINRYFIVWENEWYLLFQLGSPNGNFKTLPNCLYAIRIKENSTSEQKNYSLIQFKKANSVKYLFEY